VGLGENFDPTLAAARTGAEWAWEAIYRDLAPPLLGYLRTSGAAEPEDVLGEVLLQAVRDLDRFSGGEREFRAWVFTIAHHRLLDARRRHSRRPAEPVTQDALERQGDVGDVEEDALERIALERVIDLIGGLSHDQRSVILLRVIGELTVEEVAMIVGKRPGAVKALQRRGLAALQRAMAKEGVTL
jgi:RNA polymerase sigma factor (sigma-70 family)